MIRILGLSAALILVSCSGGQSGDNRVFGSLSASFGSESAANSSSDDALVLPEDSVILGGVDGGAIDRIGQGQDPVATGATTPTPPTPTGKEAPPPASKDPTTPAKPPVLSDELKAKIAKCYPQWDKGAAGSTYDIRQVNVDVDKLKKSSIQLTGSKPEIVFVNISSNSKIEKVDLSLENKTGLYCLDISADKGIEKLDIAYICGAKLGLVDIEGGKAKKVNIREFCDKP